LSRKIKFISKKVEIDIFSKRRQLFEIQDYPWVPSGIREGVTDYLQFTLKETGLYNIVSSHILKILMKTGHQQIVDLCSGGGGPMVHLLDGLNAFDKKYKLVLTDLYPNIESYQFHKKNNSQISYSEEPIDACKVPHDLKGVRTMFTSFHHFDDQKAKGILKDSFDKKMPIAIFEFTERNLLTFLLCLPSFLGMFLFTPLVRPFKWSRVFWTYVIPMIPLVTLWDISASVFRTRSTQELKKMTSDLNSSDYSWEIGRTPTTLKFNIIYLIGISKN